MCGIFCLLSVASCHRDSSPSVHRMLGKIRESVKNRGPDSFASLCLENGGKLVEISASVLGLRGEKVTRQPVVHEESGDFLCWNGEVFESLFSMDESLGDTMVISRELFQCGGFSEDNLCRVFSGICGPFAFLIYHKASNRIYFGRDAMGRRSLLLGRFIDGSVIVSSVGCLDSEISFTEVETTGIFWLSLDNPIDVHCIPWSIDGTLKSPYDLVVSSPSLASSSIDETSLLFNQLLNEFTSVMTCAMKKRLLNISSNLARYPKAAILFSGGLDCTLVALFAHLVLPQSEPIDLINVSFENPRVINARKEASSVSIFDVPDRITGRNSHQELMYVFDQAPKYFDNLSRLFPNRRWNFVEVNVRYQEYLDTKSRVIDLMHPHQTVMDLSISSAFWFAARGKGTLNGKEYQSLSRVLLSGLGADELFGGYSHHRSAYFSGETPKEAKSNLLAGLQKDLSRLPTRNCGRDDRLFSDHGKEVRLPFLDEKVVEFCAKSIPIEFKCKFRDVNGVEVPRGQSEKYFLRELAKTFGFESVSREQKRAIQFGAKTAKMERKEKGDDFVTNIGN